MSERGFFWCPEPWSSMAVACDGRVTCGCGDPFMRRVLGDANEQSIEAIFHGDRMTAVRDCLRQGVPHAYCADDCPMGRWFSSSETAPPIPAALPRPAQLFIEPTIICNLSCANDCCARDTGIRETRRSQRLDRELFSRIVAETGPHLHRMDFYNYGESFLHPETPAMIEALKTRFPSVYANVSTNGLPLATSRIQEAVVRSGLDELLFSIDGADQETYARYRRGGSLDKALANLRGVIETRDRLGFARPYVIWRYILFRWNDSDQQMERAERLAAQIGVDRFCYEVTEYPAGAPSERFKPGSVEFERVRYKTWSYTRHGMKRLFRTIRLSPVARAGRPFTARIKVTNTGALTWKASTRYGLRHVALAARLLDHDGGLIERDFARAALPRDVDLGDTVELTVTCPAIARRGRYRLQFDMVYEGVAWFSQLGNAGDPPVERRLFII